MGTRGGQRKKRTTHALAPLSPTPTAEPAANNTGLSPVLIAYACTPLCEFLFSVFQLKTKALGFGRSPNMLLQWFTKSTTLTD